jgi:hypothetical protein
LGRGCARYPMTCSVISFGTGRLVFRHRELYRSRLRQCAAANSTSSTGVSIGPPFSRVHKFGERRHWAVPSAFVAVPSLALGLARSPAFPNHEATVAGHLKWGVGGRSAPGVQQDLRATRKVPRLLERLGSAVSSPAMEPLSLMIGCAWSCSVPLR